MIKIMSINAGSSSLKFQLLIMPEEVIIASGIVEKIGIRNSIYTINHDGEKKETIHDIKNHKEAVSFVLHDLLDMKIIENYDEIKGVGHRIVQGGEEFESSVVVDDKNLKVIANLSDLAPLHNPAAVVGIKAFMQALPNVPHVAVFDTTFHQTMKNEVYMYATPYEWYEKYKIRKYGMHGTSHRYVSIRTAELLNKKITDVNIIVCHIGNGASICAVQKGKSVDTSMGLTPLGGIPMGTRSGDIDPAVISYISQKEKLSIEEITDILNKKSGYIGVSGVSSDARDLTKGMNNGNERCKLAFNIQSKRIVDYIASYYVYMGGADAIAFTAGIGENVIHLRKNIVDRLSVLGIKLDEEANNVRSVERMISTKDSKIKVFIVPTNEEVMIARDTLKLCNIK